MSHRVAVIGAGLAGLSCARVLRQAGCYVEVFEKDRIIGGRMATARVGTTTFDHGAQYITSRSSKFSEYLEEMVATSYATRWKPITAGGEGKGQMLPWYVGMPGMASLVRPLAESVRITTGKSVHTIQRNESGPRDGRGWELWFEDGSKVGPFSAVAVTAPAPVTKLIMGPLGEMADTLNRARMSPCWAVLVKLDDKIFPVQDVFSDMSEVIRWIARNNSKPGRRGGGEHIVIHAAPDWSRDTMDASPEEVATEIWEEVSHVLGLPPARPAQMSAFLWRYGLVDTSLGESFRFSSEHMVGCAGDWCLGRLAEHAFDSGHGLGKAMVGALF